MKLLRLLLLLAGLSSLQLHAAEQPEEPSTINNAPMQEEVSLSLRGRELRVINGEGKTLDIYNVTGIKVTSLRIDSPDKTLMLSMERGIYIIKIGKTARRINVV